MPPPRLSRHLRPCRPPWSAHHVRCASLTARPKPSVAGDDRAERSSPTGEDGGQRAETSSSNDNPNTQQKRSWWASAVDRLSSFTFGTAAPHASTHPSPAEHESEFRKLSSAAPAALDSRSSDLQSNNDGIDAIGSAAPSQATQEKAHAGPIQRPRIKKHPSRATDAELVTAHHNNIGREDRRLVAAKDDTHSKDSATTRTKRVIPTNTAQRKHHSSLESWMAPEHNNEAKKSASGRQPMSQEALEKRIQELFEQESTKLKKFIEQQIAAVTTPSKPGIDNVISKRDEAVHEGTSAQSCSPFDPHADASGHAKGSTRQIQQVANRQPIVPADGHNAGGKSWGKSSPQSVLALGERSFIRSTSQLIHTINTLRRCKPSIGKPLIAMIERRLAVIAQDAHRESDDRMVRMLKDSSQWNAISHVIMAPTVARLVERFDKEYRQFANVLASSVTSLKGIGLPSVAPIIAVIRDRLATMFEEANSEQNIKLRQALLSHRTIWARDHHRPGTSSFARTTEYLRYKDKRTAPSEPSLPAQSTLVPVDTAATSNTFVPPNKLVKVAESESTSDYVFHNRAPTGGTDAPSLCTKNDRHIISRQSQIRRSVSILEGTKTSDIEPKDGTKTPSDNVDGTPAEVLTASDGASDQSLLEELFPEANVAHPVRQAEKPKFIPKLDPPKATNSITRNFVDRPKTLKEQAIESLQKRGERITVLQLEHCSTELTESDFRRLIPKGEHIEAWNRLGAYYKVIPGRDPLSLERLPFYYLLFKSPQSALAYQKNAGRLHKLAALHQPSSLFSAIPAPKGFLEDGEDIDAVTNSYLLRPTEYAFTLRTIMQPYHPALRTLFEEGGYRPIVPEMDDKRRRIFKVLMAIEGYEPSISDLFKTLRQDAFIRGTPFTLRNESSSSVHRLRDLINLKIRTLPISTSNPRAWDSASTRFEFEDPSIAYFMKNEAHVEEENAKAIMSQMVMNRVYNRWILDFDDEDEARRFAISWHRRVLPDFIKGERTWKDYEEVRICNTELLW